MREEIRRKLSAEFAAKRERALKDAAQRKQTVYQNIPALSELDGIVATLNHTYFLDRMEGKGDEKSYLAAMAEISKRREELMRGQDISPHFECPDCEDTGLRGGQYCHCFVNRMIEENLADANLSVTSTDERFDTFDFKYYSDQQDATYGIAPKEHMRHIYSVCQKFALSFDETDKSLLLVGAPGLGKTFLSSAIAHEVLSQGKTVVYISAGEFANRVQANRFGDLSEEMQKFYDSDLLILDDLGTEFRTQAVLSALGEVIDRRLRSNKKMVFSTNLTLGEMEKTYSARIISRFMGHFRYLPFIGSDIRRQKGK